MKRYQARIPRAVLGFASIVMSAITLAVTVVVPAEMAFDHPELCVVEASRLSLVATAGDAGRGHLAQEQPIATR